jgi:hypothetical protein
VKERQEKERKGKKSEGKAWQVKERYGMESEGKER